MLLDLDAFVSQHLPDRLGLHPELSGELHRSDASLVQPHHLGNPATTQPTRGLVRPRPASINLSRRCLVLNVWHPDVKFRILAYEAHYSAVILRLMGDVPASVDALLDFG